MRRTIAYNHPLLLLLTGFLSLSILLLPRLVHSKEVIPREDGAWTRVEEGDTIPAGLHVRMDLESGQKFVRILSQESEDGSANANAVSVVMSEEDPDREGYHRSNEEEEQQEAVVDDEFCSDASLEDASCLDNNNDDGTNDDNSVEDGYDYVAMHKALSHLPVNEKERIGGLPDLPEGYESSNDKHGDFAEFEHRMREIWESRQRELEDAQMNDITKELMKHIGILEIELHVEDPKYSRQVNVDSFDLLDSLENLEYLLSDVDAARDFHTLGGWPLLISLLINDESSVVNQNVTTEAIVSQGFFSDDIRMAALWAIGTAVKNIEEFTDWSIEQVNIHTGRTWMNVTALSAPLLILQEHQKFEYLTPEIAKLQQKCIYAVGSSLRGNIKAQRYFLDISGPTILANTLHDLVSEKKWKLASKFILLASDMIQETLDIRDEMSGTKAANDVTIDEFSSTMIAPYTSSTWCDGALSLLESPKIDIKEKALMALGKMAPYCVRYGGNTWENRARQKINPFITSWKNDRGNTNIDEEWWSEIMHLLEEVVTFIGKK
eukprot:CAMPEP_0116077018 /NCGR_PEP_ID=MMETSP0322-20121206/17609_1 /TAXON_ID=163516 /ORGANISM="Leptocylindrus danicus var. apora, Strain B651" /LENGTH=549 /DNA_ID=CAMNT_0003567445 /DNA_START=81 /DNA_END=1730 /DNA_ORIENTATION=+